MDADWQKLARELRRESCPPAVLERVEQRLACERSLAHAFRARIGWALAGCALVAAVAAWQIQQFQTRRAAALAAQTRAERVRIVQQTEGALAYVGQALLQAAARTEDSLSKQAVPPLRNSLKTAKSKLVNCL